MPEASEWEVWKRGLAEWVYEMSARRPVKAEVLSSTSRCTSLEMPSIFPGFDRPKAARLSAKDVYTSAT